MHLVTSLTLFALLAGCLVDGLIQVPASSDTDDTASGDIETSKRIHRRSTTYRMSRVSKREGKWLKHELTWSLGKPSRYVSQEQARAAVQKAFQRWSEVADLSFVEMPPNTQDADIIVDFATGEHGDGHPFDGRGKTLAHAMMPVNYGRYALDGDLHFDDDEGFHLPERKGALETVAVHEIGHSLGLGHSPGRNDVMYFSTSDPTLFVPFSPTDIENIQKLYGPPKTGINPTTVAPSRPTSTAAPIPSRPDRNREPVVRYPKANARQICKLPVDAIVRIERRGLFVFKKQWVLQFEETLNSDKTVNYRQREDPADFHSVFTALPTSVQTIDAGYQRSSGEFYLFSGRKYWLLRDLDALAPDFPEEGLPLTDLGLPATITRVNAMFRVHGNPTTYLISNPDVWLFREDQGEHGVVASYSEYPMRTNRKWQGAPAMVDEVFTTLGGETLFFSNGRYYMYDERRRRVNAYSRPADQEFLGCA